MDQREFLAACSSFLNEEWISVTSLLEAGHDAEALPSGHELIPHIEQSLSSATKTYHYVLPTQLPAKCVDSSLDCRSVQASFASPGAFDARTVAHKVVVPFDQANHRVLGGSAEPYVNNPLRVPAIIAEHRDQQKARGDWDILVRILAQVQHQSEPAFTRRVFRQVLASIFALLSGATVVYPVPNRVSLDNAVSIIDTYLAQSSGGERLETLCTALFQTIAARWRLFDDVKREKVNAPDIGSGMVADIECISNLLPTLFIEVKDRSLTMVHLDAKLDQARARRLTEILFIARGGPEHAGLPAIVRRVEAEFIAGHNVYVSECGELCKSILLLLGEAGRVHFLSAVGAELDRVNASIAHRNAWANLLRTA